MKRITGLFLSVMLIVALAGIVGCGPEKPKEDAMLGTWAKLDGSGGSISITKEGEQYFYIGAYGKAPATRIDDNTMKASMPPFELDIVLDPATGELTVGFNGEAYKYKKAQ